MEKAKSILYVVSREIQLMTVLNLCQKTSENKDLLFVNYNSNKWNKLVKRLIDKDIFNNIYIYNKNEPIENNTNNQWLQKDVIHSFDCNNRFSIDRYMSIFTSDITILDKYSQKIRESDISINLFDEGVLSYFDSYIEQCNSFIECKDIYLYDPRLANYSKKYNLYKIDKISSKNKELIELYNYIFNYNELLIGNGLLEIFFSQPFKIELSLKARLRKLFHLFQNRSIGEYVDYETARCQDNFINQIRLKKPNLLRKKHPIESDIENTVDIDYPWELYLLNNDEVKVKQYSLYSSVLCCHMILNESYNIKSYYLYPYVVKLISEKYKIDNSILINELTQFFNKAEKLGYVTSVKNLHDLGEAIDEEI
jgi:hypothetical protein|nr:hypothetical protein [uncultured Veillonella sp.]